jgi:ERCC4-type nuclease
MNQSQVSSILRREHGVAIWAASLPHEQYAVSSVAAVLRFSLADFNQADKLTKFYTRLAHARALYDTVHVVLQEDLSKSKSFTDKVGPSVNREKFIASLSLCARVCVCTVRNDTDMARLLYGLCEGGRGKGTAATTGPLRLPDSLKTPEAKKALEWLQHFARLNYVGAALLLSEARGSLGVVLRMSEDDFMRAGQMDAKRAKLIYSVIHRPQSKP